MTAVAEAQKMHIAEVAVDVDKLVEDNMMLVYSICHKMPWQHLFDDMVSVGMLALVLAAQRFDPTRGFTFSTFAVAYIRGHILTQFRDVDEHGIRYSRSMSARPLVSSLNYPTTEDENLTLETILELGVWADHSSVEIEEFMSGLDDRLRGICKLLLRGALQREIATHYEISQPHAHRLVSQIRRRYLEYARNSQET